MLRDNRVNLDVAVTELRAERIRSEPGFAAAFALALGVRPSSLVSRAGSPLRSSIHASRSVAPVPADPTVARVRRMIGGVK